ncbi:MAG: hypothetical protein IPN15_11030 [Saprospiraceae bacterium]|nr:hypothetical protein [Candidatus Vicinibacter affinis]
MKPTQSNQQKKSDTSIGQWNFTPDRQGSFDNYAWLGILLFLALIFLLPLKGDRLKQDLTFHSTIFIPACFRFKQKTVYWKDHFLNS